MSQTSYVICHDCKAVMASHAATRVRVHAEVDEDNAPTLAAWVCKMCLASDKYADPLPAPGLFERLFCALTGEPC